MAEAREISPAKKSQGEISTWQVLLKILPAAGGSFIEWYEFAIYSYVSTYITGNFFEGHGGSLATWAGFAVTFAFRPLGGATFGYIADAVGRAPAMQLTIVLMLVTTIAQGCLPTFHCCGGGWGWFGLVSLLICRALQGLSAGGELSTAAVYISEVSPARTLGLNLSWISVSGTFGAWVVAALFIFILESFLTKDEMMSWGWRIPYITSVLPGALLIFARKYLTETEDFEDLVNAAIEKNQVSEAEMGNQTDNVESKTAAIKLSPLRDLCANHKLAVLMGSLGTAGIGAMWYVVPIYGISFIQKYDDIAANSATLSAMICYLIPTLLAPFVGMLVDIWGTRKVHTLALFLGCVATPIPLFYWWTHVPQSQATLAVFSGQVIVGLLEALTSAVYLWVIELFPVHVRSTGVSMAYNVGIGIFGGAGPLISDALQYAISPRGFISAPALYTLLTGIISLSAVLASHVLSRHGLLNLTHIRASPY
jgi:MHS family proline/betaine transporter-like MFS transporter